MFSSITAEGGVYVGLSRQVNFRKWNFYSGNETKFRPGILKVIFFSFILDLSKAQTSFGSMLENFKLRYVGEVETDDDYEYGMDNVIF